MTAPGAGLEVSPEPRVHQRRQAGEVVAWELRFEWGIYQIAHKIWTAGTGAEFRANVEPGIGAGPGADGEPMDLFLGSSSITRAFDAIAGLETDLVSSDLSGEGGNGGISGNTLSVLGRDLGGALTNRCAENREDIAREQRAKPGMVPHEIGASPSRTAPVDANGLARCAYTSRGLARIDGMVACAWGVASASQMIRHTGNPRGLGAVNEPVCGKTGIGASIDARMSGSLVSCGETGGVEEPTVHRAIRLVLGDMSFSRDLGTPVRGRFKATSNLQAIVLGNGGS